MKPHVDVSLRSGLVAFAVVAVLFALPAYIYDSYYTSPVNLSVANSTSNNGNGRVAGVNTVAQTTTNRSQSNTNSNDSASTLGLLLLLAGGGVLLTAGAFWWRQRNSSNYLGFALPFAGIWAFGGMQPVVAASSIRPPTDRSLVELIQGVIGLLPGLILLVLLGMIIYGGYVRLSAAGDADKEEQSNKILTAAILGFVIIALAPLIINLLGQFLGLGTLVGS